MAYKSRCLCSFRAEPLLPGQVFVNYFMVTFVSL